MHFLPKSPKIKKPQKNKKYKNRQNHSPPPPSASPPTRNQFAPSAAAARPRSRGPRKSPRRCRATPPGRVRAGPRRPSRARSRSRGPRGARWPAASSLTPRSASAAARRRGTESRERWSGCAPGSASWMRGWSGSGRTVGWLLDGGSALFKIVVLNCFCFFPRNVF